MARVSLRSLAKLFMSYAMEYAIHSSPYYYGHYVISLLLFVCQMIITASSLVDQAAETSWPVGRLFQMCRQGRCARLMIARCHQSSRLILHCRWLDATTRTSSRNWRSPERSLARPMKIESTKAVSKRFHGTKINLAQGGRLHLLDLIVVHHG